MEEAVRVRAIAKLDLARFRGAASVRREPVSASSRTERQVPNSQRNAARKQLVSARFEAGLNVIKLAVRSA